MAQLLNVLLRIVISAHLHLFMNSVSFAMGEIGRIFRRPQGNLHLELLKSASCTNEDKMEKTGVPERDYQQRGIKKEKRELLKRSAIIRYQLCGWFLTKIWVLWICMKVDEMVGVCLWQDLVLSQILTLVMTPLQRLFLGGSRRSHLSVPSIWKLHGNPLSSEWWKNELMCLIRY